MFHFVLIGGEDSSTDTQSAQQTTLPVVHPRSHSGGEKKLKQRNEGSLPSDTSTDTKHPHPPNPRPRSDTSQPLLKIHESLTIDDGPTACTSRVTSMESSSSDNNIHSEAHTSLESSSPGHSLESAYSSEKVVFGERNVGDWINVDVNVDSKDAPTSLDSQPRARERCVAFSTKSDKRASDMPKKPKSIEAYANPSVDIHTDIQNAKHCWYCTNLTTLEICDVCGNRQKKRLIT